MEPLVLIHGFSATGRMWDPVPGPLPMSDDPQLVTRTITEFVGRAREPAAVASG